MSHHMPFSLENFDHDTMEAAKKRGMQMRGTAFRAVFSRLFGWPSKQIDRLSIADNVDSHLTKRASC